MERPIYVFCGTGDLLCSRVTAPVDSIAAIEALFEWMDKTYQVERVYWRGGQTYMWYEYYKLGKENQRWADHYLNWLRHVYYDLHIHEAAIAAAKRRGMEIYLYSALFEHGVQPDVGIIGPHLFEDRLRIDHPEWCPIDRWGERRCPGPISFCYPEARKALIERYMNHVTQQGYDGHTFYTYVENWAIRYEDEFGFNQPIVDEFNKRYPEVNLREDMLTAEQKLHWYKCRGKFVTDFLREYHKALAEKGKKLSIVLESKAPHYAQHWWDKPSPGMGKVYMDWEAWVDEGIVDELWAYPSAVFTDAEQKTVLEDILAKCEGKPVQVVFRTKHPFDELWESCVRAGATPLTSLTQPNNGIDRIALEETNHDTLHSSDWRLRAQTLTDIASGRIGAAADMVAALAEDPHVLVRRRVMQTLGALNAIDQVTVLEKGLSDTESSVRIAAADALRNAGGPKSVDHILLALEKDGYFQMKDACVNALGAMPETILPRLSDGLKSPCYAVREVCARALANFWQAFQSLRPTMLDSAEDERVRYHVIDSLRLALPRLPTIDKQQLIRDLLSLVDTETSVMLQLHAVYTLSFMPEQMSAKIGLRVRTKLVELFREYGDGCRRSDAAFGWRVVGNALLAFGESGRARLEEMRMQKEDRWLAWLAYEVVYAPHLETKMILCDEKDAVETHKKYAPPFPGYRTW